MYPKHIEYRTPKIYKSTLVNLTVCVVLCVYIELKIISLFTVLITEGHVIHCSVHFFEDLMQIRNYALGNAAE